MSGYFCLRKGQTLINSFIDLRTDQRTNKTRDSKSFRQTYISWEIIKNKRNLHWIARNCGNSIEVINSNYANNLQHEDFFEEKITAIPIL